MPQADDLSKALISGDRIALGKAITLIESRKPEDRTRANELLKKILPNTGNSIRIGITGVPGVGKSTFIEAIGQHITNQGKKLAVLAIDPSSPNSKGSILGDKTRMEKLAGNPKAFIRPTASGGQLGGVANRTLEAILLCEAAGYEVIIVETVGVGQSEVAVRNMTDIFLLLMLAGAGDELQGIKRGIIEMADIMIINKADGSNEKPAKLARKTYENALHLLAARESGWQVPVMTASALHNVGLPESWAAISKLERFLNEKGLLQTNRERQTRHWFNEILGTELMNRIHRHEEFHKMLTMLEEQVIARQVSPFQASDQLLNKIFPKS